MLRAVLVRNERHNRRDDTTLGHRRTSEDTQIGVADEVARTANTIHHLRTADMGRVDITIEVGLDSGIDGDDT